MSISGTSKSRSLSEAAGRTSGSNLVRVFQKSDRALEPRNRVFEISLVIVDKGHNEPKELFQFFVTLENVESADFLQLPEADGTRKYRFGHGIGHGFTVGHGALEKSTMSEVEQVTDFVGNASQ